MVVIDPHQLKIGKIIVLHELIELALPFLVAPVIRKTLIEAAKIRIGKLQKMRARGKSDACAASGGVMQQKNGGRGNCRRLLSGINAEENKNTGRHARAPSPIPHATRAPPPLQPLRVPPHPQFPATDLPHPASRPLRDSLLFSVPLLQRRY